MTSRRDVVEAALAVADDAAQGKLEPASLDAALAEECRHLFGTVTADGPLWELQVEVARGVLAASGIPAAQLREWAAVAEARIEAAADIID